MSFGDSVLLASLPTETSEVIAPELLHIGWVAICAALVLVMQGGFCSLETGLVRSKNSINVAMKNLMDFCLSSVIFFSFGFAVLFGVSFCGVFGTNGFFLRGVATPWELAFFLFQMMFCGAATTIVSGAVAERMRFSGYILIAAVVAGLLYPFFGHWVWGGGLTGQRSGWLARLGFIDYAGATVVHSVGGWAALAAAIVVGPRLGRFGDRSNRLKGHNLPMAVLGVVMLWFGWMGFNAGSGFRLTSDVPVILVNTCVSGAFGGFVAFVVSAVVYRRWDVNHSINGVIAGLVAISASCDAVSPIAAVVIGGVASCICLACSRVLENAKIDDVICAFPAHACAGIWGTLAVSIFAPLDAFGGVGRIEQFFVQAIGVATCFGWSFGVGYSIFWLLNRIRPFRVKEREEQDGLNVAEHRASTEILDLLFEIRDHQVSKGTDFVEVDRHTEAGQIADLYNKVVGVAESERRSAEMFRRSEGKIRAILDTANDGFFSVGADGSVQRWNAASTVLFGWEHDEAIGLPIEQLLFPLHQRNRTDLIEIIYGAAESGERLEFIAGNRLGREFPIEISASLAEDDGTTTINCFVQDITLRRELEQQNAQSQKLESIGQLAAGVAHEINTPTQFVGDNAQFLKEAFGDLDQVTSEFEKLLNAVKTGAETDGIVKRLEELIDEVDLASLQEEIPNSIDQSIYGLDRVSSIVQAMTEFSHPGSGVMEQVDLNRVVENMVTVSRNEWKYVATLRLDLDGQLPLVTCDSNELKQVMLNIIVNAAHAIGERYGTKETRLLGEIVISTRHVDQEVEIRISDNGTGIPDNIRQRIFDPFFTTKELGRGTGQGLSIAYRSVVEKHNGTIGVESELGKGADFVIRLPVKQLANAESNS